VDRLNQWLALIANFGVLLGIVFLAFEIRLNTQAITADISTQYIENWTESVGTVATDPDLARIYTTIESQGWNAVPIADQVRVNQWSLSQLKTIEFVYYQWRQGLLDEELWRSNNRATYAFIFSGHVTMEVWNDGFTRELFPPVFQAYMDDMVKDICQRKSCRNQNLGIASAEMIEGIQAWDSRGLNR